MKGKPKPNQREAQTSLLSLLDIITRLRAESIFNGGSGKLDEADRTRIITLLSSIANDEDVRDYYWQTVPHRVREYEPLKFYAAVIYAIEEAKGVQRDKQRKATAELKTGLTKGQVDHAVRDYGAAARRHVEMFVSMGRLADVETLTLQRIADV